MNGDRLGHLSLFSPGNPSQSTLIKVSSKRCWSVGPLKHPTFSAAARRALRNVVDIIDHLRHSLCLNRENVIGREDGGISAKLIALAGSCLRFLIVIKFNIKEKSFNVWDRPGRAGNTADRYITSLKPSQQ
jgi:hypothetical protein